MNTFLHTNIAYLRKLRKRSQDEVAIGVGVKRTTYAGWELGNSEPSLGHLLTLSKYYRVDVDNLLTQDLSGWLPSNIERLQRSYDVMQLA